LYTGRIAFNDSVAAIYWQGSSIKLNFEGSELKVLIQDEHGKNYFNIIIDQDSIILFKPDSIKKWYSLVSGLKNKKHSIEIFKRTEWTNGTTYIYGFETGKNTKLSAPPKRLEKTIEFFGNSITAGYAIMDTIGDSPDSTLTNNYLTYAAITARHFNANYYSTSRSGIGVTVSWFPMIMEEMYYRLNPWDSTSHWDFAKVQPDLVVINLLQNDSWIIERPNFSEFKHRFGNKKPSSEYIVKKYKSFLQKLRAVYPDADIICSLGPMDAIKEGSLWKEYIKEAVLQMDDPKVYTLFFPYQNYEGHPETRTHKRMAETLIQFIKKHKIFLN